LATGNDWPIVIGGSHRSGTTLLRRLLNGHPRIFCPPEIKFHKDLLAQYPDDPLAHGRLGSSLRGLGLPTETWLDEFGNALCRCYDIATRKAGKSRWADKNPENTLNIAHWDRLLGGHMTFVLVARHPLDIIASIAEIPMNKDIPTDIVGRAAHVRDYITAGLAFADDHSERSILVRYERLVSEPKGTLISLMSFLGEEYDDAMINNLHTGYHGEGLEDPKARHHVDISSRNIGRWQRDLSADQVSLAKPLLAAICQRLDYEI
jgi:sulfotransferase family protein